MRSSSRKDAVTDDRSQWIEWGREVVVREGAALEALAGQLGGSFADCVECFRAVVNRGGRIVLTGSGKSGLVARKIAATLCSTAAPAVFLHPADAAHGDLGLLTSVDALLIISRSGNPGEMEPILGAAERLGIPVISWTGNSNGALAEEADTTIVLDVGPEADLDDLIPSTSSTAALALGDAVAIALFRARGLRAEDFAQLHPGGQLGRRLSLRVRDLMRAGEDFPRVAESQTILDVLHVISDKRLGLAVVCRSDETLAGVLTDGDVRRALLSDEKSLHRPVADVMTRDPQTISPDELVERAIRRMESPKRRITALIVIDGTKPVGVLHLHACLDAGFR